uniref:RRM domain-containing protein n=2 Tax=Kalanchoe fedtschenkoi TaxID=63787 RepID=A0A7N0UJT6_KALFE
MAAGSSSASSSTCQHYRSPFGDTTLTKVFVGGLAWETPTEKMREHFEQFGEILEAVIITDKHTAKSKGYGFVTFRDPEAAKRAVADANPMIDGRRANCNIAAAGRPRQSPPRWRRQGESGQIHYPGAPASSSNNPTQAQGPLISPPPVPASAQVMYPSYGYTTAYNREYGYRQAAIIMHSQQLHQQAQFYQQMFGSASPISPTAQPPHHLFYYAYSTHAGGAAYSPALMPPQLAASQRSQGPFLSPSSLSQSPTGSHSSFHPQSQKQQQTSASSDSSRRQQLPSQIELLESSHVTSPETEAKVVPSEAPSD